MIGVERESARWLATISTNRGTSRAFSAFDVYG